MMILRPFNINDAETILSWCKDKHAFRLWSADRYKDFPGKPEEMMEQYEGDNMYPLTAVVEEEIIGHILLRFPSEDKVLFALASSSWTIRNEAMAMASKCCASLSIMHSGNWVLRRLPLACFATTNLPSNVTSPSVSASLDQMPIRLTERNGKVMKWN